VFPQIVLFTKYELIGELLNLIKVPVQSYEIEIVVLSDGDYDKNSNGLENLIVIHQIEILKYTDFLKNTLKSSYKYDCGISFMFGTKFKEEMSSVFEKGIVNFHPSLLPLNRGSDPITWAIFDETKHGISAHLVDSEIDQGPILFQEEIEFDFSFTAESLYELSIFKLKNLMIEIIPKWLRNEVVPKIQNGESSSHKKSELAKIRSVNYSDLKDKDNLIRHLRASSFSSKDGLKLKYANKTYNLYLKIEEQNEN
jgi:methionyl-tRNA formyltransferase